ncbi:MAG: hypothetical protein ACOYYJ_16800 [Chloroflexota bacterium]
MRIQNMKSQIRWLILVFGGSILLVILSMALSTCPNGPTTEKPYFIDEVWPPPNSKIPVGCFARKSMSRWFGFRGEVATIFNTNSDVTPSIAVFIIQSQIDQQLDERIFLFIDHKRNEVRPEYISTTSRYVYNQDNILDTDPLYYFFAWYPMLPPGDHTARFEIHQRDGTIYEYEWSFTITWW